jgi:hypothetical protein
MRKLFLPKNFQYKFRKYSHIKKTSFEKFGFFELLFFFWKNFLFWLEKFFELAFFNKKIILRDFHFLNDLKKVFRHKNFGKNATIFSYNKKLTIMKIVKNKPKKLPIEKSIVSGKTFRKFIFGIYTNKRINEYMYLKNYKKNINMLDFKKKKLEKLIEKKNISSKGYFCRNARFLNVQIF